MIPAEQALKRLVEGNKRFVDGASNVGSRSSIEKRDALVAGQHPHAIILGCSDSRVPAEIVFDQDIGDLFVVRVAGNIVAPSQIASVEFAAAQFSSKLVVVLGHTNCGAISATLEQLKLPVSERSPSMSAIVEHIRPVVEKLTGSGLDNQPDELKARAVRANITASVAQLRSGSDRLADLVANQGLTVVGAEYSLQSGKVEFFEGLV